MLQDPECIKQLGNVLKTNVRACTAVGHPFVVQVLHCDVCVCVRVSVCVSVFLCHLSIIVVACQDLFGHVECLQVPQ